MRILLCCAVVVALGAACADARATITILKSDGTEATEAEATKTYNEETGGWDITLSALYAPGLWTRYDIHGNEGETIDNVFIDVPWALGSPVLVNVESDLPGGIATVRNILQTGTAETILGSVEVREDIGSIEVETIGKLHAGRDILGPLHSTQDHSSVQGFTDVVAERHILGDITADKGRIVLIVAYGAIGSEDHPVALRARHGIIQIAGFEGVWANINTRANGGAGRLFAFGAPLFIGSLETEELYANPFNGLPGRIVVTEHFDADITIGKSFVDPEQWMDLPVHGLQGQVIINADNDPAGAWSAPIKLGLDGDPEQIILSGPHYEHDASLLGGGSVGLVPFALHAQSCDPPDGGVIVQHSPSEPTSVRLRHYGPIAVDGDAPLVIERREIGSGEPHDVVPLALFAIAVVPDDVNTVLVGPGSRSSGFEAGWEYRISPTAQLVCAVPARPPVAWLNSYEVTIEAPACPADIDGNGAVNTADLLMLLGDWGPAADSPADLDGNGFVDVADLLTLLASWGPC